MTCTSCHTPQIAHTIWDQATALAPTRRTDSDGACPSAEHIKNSPNSDHNPSGPGCFGHAVDLSHDPAHGMDAHGWADEIAAQYIAAGPAERQARFGWLKYIVSFNGVHDIIFDPSVSLTWRLNSTGTEHYQHTHFSITDSGLTFTGPIFVSATHTGDIEVVEPKDIQAIGRYVANLLVVKRTDAHGVTTYSGLLTEMVKDEIAAALKAAK